jgi:ubiquitin-activating enzyme E1
LKIEIDPKKLEEQKKEESASEDDF